MALENLKVFKREKTLQRLTPKRQWMTDFLTEIAAHPHVGHVRQAGFMAGIELVSDKKTHQPFPLTTRRGNAVCQMAMAEGAWLRPLGDVIVLLPPLTLTFGEWSRLTTALRKSDGKGWPEAEKIIVLCSRESWNLP